MMEKVIEEGPVWATRTLGNTDGDERIIIEKFLKSKEAISVIGKYMRFKLFPVIHSFPERLRQTLGI